MASVNRKHEYVSKGHIYTLGELLDWASAKLSGEDGEGKSIEDWVCYGILRAKALHKDQKRHEAGKLAAHLYSPRIDKVEEVPRGLAPAVEALETIAARLAPEPAPKASKPAKASKASKPSKPAPEHRLDKAARKEARAIKQERPAVVVTTPPVLPVKRGEQAKGAEVTKPAAPVVRKARATPVKLAPVEAKPAEPVKAPEPTPVKASTDEVATMVDGKLVWSKA